MTAPTPAELLIQTEAIYDKYPDYWRNEEALAELRAIWGDAVSPVGVFVGTLDEVLYDRDGCRASISIGTAHGVFAYGCGYQSPTEGFGFAPSLTGELFSSHGEARTAAIERLLKQLPEPGYPHEEGQRNQISRMREAVANLLRQPSLF